MGVVGAIVLAVLHHPRYSRRGKIAGLVALGAIGTLALPGLILWGASLVPAPLLAAAHGFFRAAKTPLFIVFYAGLIVVLWEAVLIAELRGLIRQAFESTMRITSMVIFILIGSTVFTLVFRGVDGDLWIEHWLTSLPGGVVGFLVAVNLFVFVLAFFLDFFEIAFIIIPLLAPVATKLGIDLVWFGVLLCVNMQTSFMHPPFGFALFYLRGIAPREVRSSSIYWGAIPWVGLQLIMVVIVILWPGLVTAFLDSTPKIDPSKVEIIIPAPEAPAGPGPEGTSPREAGQPPGAEESLEDQFRRQE
jgi:TRAP-type C4-dicarboxylate transport system permease large subunit